MRQPTGQGPQVLVGVKKYPGEQVLHELVLVQAAQPLRHPTHTPDIELVLGMHSIH